MGVRYYLGRFLVLSWTLHRAQWNRPIELLWILLTPILMCFIAVGMRLRMDVSERFYRTHEPIDLEQSWTDLIETLGKRQEIVENLNRSNNVFTPELIIAYAPDDYNLFELVIKLSAMDLHSMRFEGHANCSSMMSAVSKRFLFAGICFDKSQFEKNYEFEDDYLGDREILIPHFNYSLVFPSELRIFNDSYIGDNWKTIYHGDPKTSIVHRLNWPNDHGHVDYVREGFIQMQRSITENFLKVVSRQTLPTIVLRRFPVDGHIQDPLLNYIHRGLPLLICIGFLFPSQLLIWEIVQHKSKELHQFLINCNMNFLLHHLAFYLKALTYMLLSSICIVLAIKIHWNNSHSLLTQTPWYIVLLTLVSYIVASISLTMMVASFFKNSAMAIRVFTIIWLLSMMPFFVLWNNRENTAKLLRYVSYAFPNTMLALTFEGLIEREFIFHRVWDKEGYSLNYGSSRMGFFMSIYVLLITAVVYFVIGLNVEIWNVGELERRRSRFRPATNVTLDVPNRETDEDIYMPRTSSYTHEQQFTKIYEVEPSHRHFKIRIRDLCKHYKSSKNRSALNSFTLNVYEHEVTVLMGHNACGKTTLLKIIAGLLEPSQGEVLISNRKGRTGRKEAALEMGLALNNDLLLPDLTVAQQIRFMCLVKGCSWPMATTEMELYTERLEIDNLLKRKVKSLTAQQLSLLNICCAFVGGSSIILIDDIHCDLDLPTHSLICDLLNEEKHRRTIICVTNSTAVANKLADRMAIMSTGELKCSGSKPFLQNIYGHGYRLSIVKGQGFLMENTLELLCKHLPVPIIESNIANKVTFVLEPKYEKVFPKLLDELEQQLENLNIVSFRIRDTSMEEVFLRFGSEDGDMTPDPGVVIEDFQFNMEQANDSVRFAGWRLIRSHVIAMLHMHWLLNKQLFLLKFMTVVALVMATAFSFSPILMYGKHFQLVPISFNLTQLPYIDAFVEVLSRKMDAIEMQAIFAELLFWYDGHVRYVHTDQIEDFYVLQDNDFNKVVNFRYMFGASFDSDSITVWFNNIPLHAAPYALNMVHNVIARTYFDDEATIDVNLLPLPFQTEVNTLPQIPLSLGSLLAINLSFIFGNIWAGIAIEILWERKFKKQQYLQGIGLFTYCLTTLFFDLMRVVILALLLILMISLYLSPRHELGLYAWILLVLTLSGVSVLAMSYLFVAIFKQPNYAYIVTCLLNALGIIIFVTTVGEQLTDLKDLYEVFGQYAFGQLIYKLFYINDYKWLCMDKDIRFISKDVHNCDTIPNCCQNYGYLEQEFGLLLDVWIVVLLILILISLFIIVEYFTLFTCTCLHTNLLPDLRRRSRRRRLNELTKRKSSRILVSTLNDDSLAVERQIVKQLSDKDRYDLALVCQELRKTYGSNNVILRLDLAMNKSECIGLMGDNNSGKTTFLRMLLGEVRPTGGRIWIGGHDLSRKRHKCYTLIGYCSQQSCLPAVLTPQELLMIHARLAGFTSTNAEHISEILAQLLDFHNCYRHQMGQCTTGQKRRIGLALAMLGEPLLICIDGPPGGIDPIGKRMLFSMTAYLQQRGSAFIYTNLASFECERICQRNPILCDGQLWTVGAQQERYYAVYLLEIRLKGKINEEIATTRDTWNRINQIPTSPQEKLILFLELKLPEAQLLHEDGLYMSFYMPSNSTTFSEIFMIIRQDVYELNIDDFYITRNVFSDQQSDLFGRFTISKNVAL